MVKRIGMIAVLPGSDKQITPYAIIFGPYNTSKT